MLIVLSLNQNTDDGFYVGLCIANCFCFNFIYFPNGWSRTDERCLKELSWVFHILIITKGRTYLRTACLIIRLWRGLPSCSWLSFCGFHSISLVLESSFTPAKIMLLFKKLFTKSKLNIKLNKTFCQSTYYYNLKWHDTIKLKVIVTVDFNAINLPI